MRHQAGVWALLLITAAPAAPQSPTIKTNVDEVVLDLIVRDKKGKPVTDLKPEDLTYYFRRETIIPAGKLPGMANWRKALFSAMHLNANRTAAYFGAPPAQVLEVGLEVEI